MTTKKTNPNPPPTPDLPMFAPHLHSKLSLPSLRPHVSPTSACPERIQRRVSSELNSASAPHSVPNSANSALSASSALTSDSAPLFFVFSCRLLTVDCRPPLTPTIPADTEPRGEGYTGLLVRPRPTNAKQSCPFCHPERNGRFSLPFAPRERRPCREGPRQPTQSYPNHWHDRETKLRLREWPSTTSTS